MGESVDTLFWLVHWTQSVLVGVVGVTSYISGTFFLAVRARLRIHSPVAFWAIAYLFTWGTGIWVENFPVYNRIRHYLPANNLTWYVGWILVVLAHAFVLNAFCIARKQSSHFVFASAGVACFLLTLVYFVGLRHQPERPLHAYATNIWELLFMAIFCGFLGLACAMLGGWHRKYMYEPNKIRRIREMLIFIVGASASAFYVLRFLTAVAGWAFGRTMIPVSMYLLVVLVQSAIGVIHILPFLSGATLARIFAPLIRHWEAKQLESLHILNDHLSLLTGNEVGRLVLDTGYGIRSLLVSILERKVSLVLLGSADMLIEDLRQIDDSQTAEVLAHQYALLGAQL